MNRPRTAHCYALMLCLGLAVGCVVVSDDDGATTEATATEATTAPGTSSGSSDGSTASSEGSGSTTGSNSDASEATSSDPSGVTDSDVSTGGSSDSGDTDSGDSGSNEGGGTIDVTLTGCNVDLGGTVVVSFNGSLGVASVYNSGGSLSGSFQFDLQGTGAIALSTQHRVDTGEVINLVDIAQGTWTNLDSDSLSGGVDRIGGTLTVNAWDPANGVSDITFTDISLLNVSTDQVCTINGTVETTELYP